MTTTINDAQNGIRRRPETDRRAFPRFRAKGVAHCRPSDRPFHPEIMARLVDLSQGGVGLLVRSKYQAGDRLAINLEGTVSGPRIQREAEVRWVMDMPDGWLRIGCSFVQRLTYAELHKFI